MARRDGHVIVSVILPVYNAAPWLQKCLQSVLDQTFCEGLELSAFNDSSTDDSLKILESWITIFQEHGISVVLGAHCGDEPRGVGYAKNQAVAQSHGEFLCFLDADDIMYPERVERQLEYAQKHPDTLVGCQFHRDPEGSTERYTHWANSLTPEQLHTQAFTSHGPTVIMPTWFCHRSVVCRVGAFDEAGKGCPEDLIFFYTHLRLGRHVHRVDKSLLIYCYHPAAATFSVKEETIWELRVAALQEQVLDKWDHFTIWNAGKQGRFLYRSLSKKNREKVQAFCDVDKKKILKGFYVYEESKEHPKPRVPIVHFTKAQCPLIICVKQDLTDGIFEKNLASLKLQEGVDFYHFN